MVIVSNNKLSNPFMEFSVNYSSEKRTVSTAKLMKKQTSIWIIILLFVLGVASLYFGIYLIQSDPSHWPSTEGKVVSADIDTNFFSGSNNSNEYSVTVKYEYSVDGVEETGNFSTSRTSVQSIAESDLTRYPVGKTIAVYYNPKDPSFSTNSAEESVLYAYTGLVLGIGMIGYAAWKSIARFLQR